MHAWSKSDEHIDDTDYYKKIIPSGWAGYIVGVVVPLHAVQNGSSADHQRCREEDDHRSIRKERMKRVVVPLADTSQKCDCRPSSEQANSRTTAFRRPTLPVLVRARTGKRGSRNATQHLTSSCLLCVFVCQDEGATRMHTTPHFYYHQGDSKPPLDKHCMSFHLCNGSQ